MWRRVIADAFVERGEPLTAMTRAWAAHLATGGVVSHRTAALLHGIAPDATTTDDDVHVTTRANLHLAVPGVTEHRVRLLPGDVTHLGGLPVTTRLRTVADLLATMPKNDAIGLLFRAVQQRWIDATQLGSQIERRRGMTGNTQLRELADLLGTGAHSPAERELHRVLASIPGLRWSANVRIEVAGEAYVVDVLVPDHRVVIEVDGRRYHSGAEAFARDRRRQNALVVAGFVILRFTWLDVIERPGKVLESLTSAIAVSSGAKVVRTGP